MRPTALRQRLAEARVIAERTVEELRRIIAALSPAVLERLGLEARAASTGGAISQAACRPTCGCEFHLESSATFA